MKHKKAIKIGCAALAALLILTGASLALLADRGRLNGYHPLQTPKEGQIRVACVGDSVTYGFGIPRFKANCYPAALQKLLGDGYCVNNYGYSGRTACLMGDRPYRVETLCTKSRAFAPDIVVILLGANDSKPFNWDTEVAGMNVYPEQFEADLKELVSVYQELPSQPEVYVATPLPAYADNSGTVRYDIRPEVITDEILPIVERVAEETAAPLIDLYSVFEGKTGLYSDGLHPTAEGAALLAQTVCDAITRGVSQKLIEEMVVDYGSYGEAAYTRVDELLKELSGADPETGNKWSEIMDLWKDAEPVLHYDVLPDGLTDTDALCIVVLGFQLEPDGTMREELIRRLETAKRSAEKYPNALIVCTGGGTAAENESATEADKMAEWLIANGVAPERVIAENRSLTTAQNAIYTFDILTEDYPQVKELAIVSSDYHIATGNLLFGAEAILRGSDIAVVSNAAWKAPSGTLSAMFQAGALIELSGDVDTAFEIYYDTYDIHELPPLDR